ncbi:DNA gyrase inhibitor YacG [Frankliniella fusca]|uniref:DNA gyrase inhibitor YacG n=1 Tax=Frankliniella fusca TaxID=407009 RepID=A0AAE1LRF0_9NEOP|nr:DNA gyrase inhibitor YacG [Frankliniella fusca]
MEWPTQGVASLKGTVPCPMCNKPQSVHLDSKKYWSIANVSRHLKEHHDKGHFTNMNALEKSFGITVPSSEDNSNPDDPGYFVSVDLTSDLDQGTSGNAFNSSQDIDQSQGSGLNNCGQICGGASPDKDELQAGSDLDRGTCAGASKVNVTSKWSQDKYSRLERNRRQLGKHTAGQQRITTYYPILNQVERVLQSNEEIISLLNARIQELSDNVNSADKVELPALLQILMNAAKKNNVKEKHGHRYDLDVKYFSCYIFILGGPMVYEFLSHNMIGAMPSSSATEKFLLKSSEPVNEGQFRFSELHEFLMRNNLPLKVWISEDGTRILQKFSYDLKSNQIIGPTPPLADNGIPILNSFPAESAAMIATHFLKGEPASSAHAIMAQPLQKGIFGTNNKFTSEHVYKRWIYVKDNLSKLGIEVLGFSSDGDPKLLTAMHAQMFNKNNVFFMPEWSSWFFASGENDFTVMQDLIPRGGQLEKNVYTEIPVYF